jgi:ribosomal 50S subunit-recycling heat shock protein
MSKTKRIMLLLGWSSSLGLVVSLLSAGAAQAQGSGSGSGSNSNSNQGGQMHNQPGSGAGHMQGSPSQGAARPMHEPAAAAPAEVEEELVTVPVTVEDVDRKNRTLVVRTPDGDKVSVNVPPDVKGIEKVKKGDKLEIDYYRALAVSVLPPGSAAPPEQRSEMQQTANGAMGGRQVSGSAEVMSVNKKTHTMQIKGSNGKRQTLKVRDPDLQKKADALKPGDVIQLTYTEAVAVALRPTPEK